MPLVPVFGKKQLKPPPALPITKPASSTNLNSKDEKLTSTSGIQYAKKPAKTKGSSKPFRSLSDAEYNDIFAAVLKNVLSPLHANEENVITTNDKGKSLEEELISVEDFDSLENEAYIYKELDESQVVPGEVVLFPVENIANGMNEPPFLDDNPLELPPSVLQLQHTPEVSDNEMQMVNPPKIKHKKHVKRRKGVKRKCLKFFGEQSKEEESHSDYHNDLDEDSVFTRSTSSNVVLGHDNVVPSSPVSATRDVLMSTSRHNINNKKKKCRISQKDYILKQQRERNLGTWVECSICHKWRYLDEVSDPVQVPRFWTCSMNSDKEYNSCEKLQEVWSEDVDKLTVFNKYTAGSIVWAKMDGFPWWPAMVDDDPDTEDFFFTDENSVATHYNVVFFGEQVTRSWISVSNIESFKSSNADAYKPRIDAAKRYAEELAVAKHEALAALQMNIKTRLGKFGFATRYSGRWPLHINSSEDDDTNERRATKKFGSCMVQKATKRRKVEKFPEDHQLLEPLATIDLLESATAVINALSDVSSSGQGSPANNQKKKKTTKKIFKRKRDKTANKKRSENLGLLMSRENVQSLVEERPVQSPHVKGNDNRQQLLSKILIENTGTSVATEKNILSEKKVSTHIRVDKNNQTLTKGFKPPLTEKTKTVPNFGKKRSKLGMVVGIGNEHNKIAKSKTDNDDSFEVKGASKLSEGSKTIINSNPYTEETYSEKEMDEQLHSKMALDSTEKLEEQHKERSPVRENVEAEVTHNSPCSSSNNLELASESKISTKLNINNTACALTSKELLPMEEFTVKSTCSGTISNGKPINSQQSTKVDYVSGQVVSNDNVKSSTLRKELQLRVKNTGKGHKLNDKPDVKMSEGVERSSQKPPDTAYDDASCSTHMLLKDELHPEKDSVVGFSHSDRGSLAKISATTEHDPKDESDVCDSAESPYMQAMDKETNPLLNYREQTSPPRTGRQTPDLFLSEICSTPENTTEMCNLGLGQELGSQDEAFSPAFVEYGSNSSNSPAFEAEPVTNEADIEEASGCNILPLDLEE